MEKILKTYFLIKNQLSYRSNLSNGLFFRIHKYFFQSYIYVFSVCLWVRNCFEAQKSLFCRYFVYFSSIERNVENKEKEEKETLNQISYSILLLDLCCSNNAEWKKDTQRNVHGMRKYQVAGIFSWLVEKKIKKTFSILKK